MSHHKIKVKDIYFTIKKIIMLDIVTARLISVGALTMYINAVKSLVGIFAIVVNRQKTKTYKVCFHSPLSILPI